MHINQIGTSKNPWQRISNLICKNFYKRRHWRGIKAENRGTALLKLPARKEEPEGVKFF